MVCGFGQGQDEKKSPEIDGGTVLKPYHKPILEELDDLRDITLGGSPGAGESGHITSKNDKPYGAAGSASTPVNNLPNLFDIQKTRQPRKK